MRVLFADWPMMDFCRLVAGLIPDVHCVLVSTSEEARAEMSPPPDLIITQPVLLNSDLKTAIQALKPPPKILLWGASTQREFVDNLPFIEVPVDLNALIAVIRKMLAEHQVVTISKPINN